MWLKALRVSFWSKTKIKPNAHSWLKCITMIIIIMIVPSIWRFLAVVLKFIFILFVQTHNFYCFFFVIYTVLLAANATVHRIFVIFAVVSVSVPDFIGVWVCVKLIKLLKWWVAWNRSLKRQHRNRHFNRYNEENQ